MSRKFIAAIMATSIAITGFSAIPAKASDRDVARLLAGVAGLVIIGKIIDDNKKRRSTVTHSYTPYYSHDSYLDDSVYRDRQIRRQRELERRRYREREIRRHRDRRATRHALPQHCLFRARTENGPVRFFGRKCLKKNYRHVGDLPRRCLRRIETRRGLRKGYSAHCMRRQGFRVAQY